MMAHATSLLLSMNNVDIALTAARAGLAGHVVTG